MKIFLNGKPADNIPTSLSPTDDIIYFIAEAELGDIPIKDVPGLDVLQKVTTRDTRFESHENYDNICIMIPSLTEKGKALQRILIYINKGCLTLVYKSVSIIEDLIKYMENTECQSSDIPMLFLRILIRNDFTSLENLEEEISNLEDSISKNLSKRIPRQISGLRRHLLKLRRYYESLFALLGDMEENNNNFFNKNQLRTLHIQVSKIDHLIHTVQMLRDYVTQVRESYQAQLDIQLNSVMKFFTVITSIFLPLTLITGWYGMNLKMPEVGYTWMYPLVVILSLVIVIGSIAYFKIKKWF